MCVSCKSWSDRRRSWSFLDKKVHSLQKILPIVISVLALIDGGVHFSLDVVLFRGNFFGRLGPPPGAGANPPGPPPGAPPGPPVPLPLPLNQLFALNCIGYVVLVALYWIAYRRLHGWWWWMNLPLIVYVAVVFLGWVDFGMPNPLGLGYLSKAIEIVLMIALLAQTWMSLKIAPARRNPSGT